MNIISINTWNRNSENTLILDIRPSEEFIFGFIPESIHIPLKKLSQYTPLLLKEATDIILIGSENDIQAAEPILKDFNPKIQISYLEGGWDAFAKSDFDSDMIIEIEADEYAMDQQFDQNLILIDARDTEAFDEAHVANAVSMPIDSFTDVINIASIDEDKNVYIHCGGGSRAVITASLFKKQGIHNLRIIEGGFKALEAEPKVKVVKAQ